MHDGSSHSTASTTAPASRLLRRVLSGSIDYAGLFPPAALEMDAAVRNYASYAAGGDAAMLGRFVAPVARLNELVDSLRAVGASNVAVSAVLGGGANLTAELDGVAEFNSRETHGVARVDCVETRAGRPEAIYQLASRRATLEAFAELPLDGELELLVEAVRAAGVRAKIRTGGVTAEAFPPAETVVRFIRACLDRGVPFKATAGLHHPFTGAYPLTYAPNAPQGAMFGFLNVLLATALLGAGMSDEDAARLLRDGDPGSFSFSEPGADWRGHHVDSARLAATHANVFGSFGSCSFREPVDELRSMALLA